MSLPEIIESSRQPLDPSGIRFSAFALNGLGQTLNFNQEHQDHEEWCWAAVGTSVSHFYDAISHWTQCSLVNAELQRNDCCFNGSSANCNKPWTLDTALDRTGNLNQMSFGTGDFNGLRNEIQSNRPLACRIGWFSGGGHFVVLHGYSTDTNINNWVAVADPWFGPSDYLFDNFASNYRNEGQWTHSYYTEQ